MFDEEILERYADAAVIEAARDLYYSGHCGTVNFTPQGFHNVLISCSVIGSDRSGRFNTRVLLNEASEVILSSECSCGRCLGDRICEHAAAAVMKFSYEGVSRAVLLEDDDKEKTAFPVPRESSGSIRTLIEGMMKEEENDISPDAMIRLTPVIVLPEPGHADLSLEMYLQGEYQGHIQNIPAFVSAVRNHGSYTVRRKTVRLNRSVFHPDSLPLTGLLCRLIPDDSSFLYASQVRRSDPVPCNAYLTDQILSLAGDEVKVMIPKRGIVSCHLVDGPAPLDFTLHQMEGGFRLSCSPFTYMCGESAVYLIPEKEDLIYRLNDPGNLRLLLEPLCGPEEHFISEPDLSAFTNYILPVISSSFHIDTGELHPERYRFLEPVFRLDLDLPKPDTVSGEAFVEYSGTEYPLPGVQRPLNADPGKEKKILRTLNDVFPGYENGGFYLQGDESIYTFLTKTVHELSEIMEVRISDRLKKVMIMPAPKFHFNVSLQSGLLQFEMLEETLSPKEIQSILSSYQKKRKFHRLKSGDFVDLDKDYDRLNELFGDLDLDLGDLSDRTVSLPLYKAVYFDGLRGSDAMQIDSDRLTRQFNEQLKHIAEGTRDVPSHLENIMRGYQKKGYSWLCSLQELGLAGLLADEMGLGKTLQVIAFLSARKNPGKTLIVCPASLVFNWANELHRFSPDLHYTVISGPATIRQELIRRSLDDDILITSYTMLQKDLTVYSDCEFSCQVIDEAQYIKNPMTGNARAVKSIRSAFRIALTGTPVENRLSELWSIFDYLLPGLLRSAAGFREEFEKPILLEHDEEVFARLRRITSPFILRRVKKDVLPDLPEKIEEIIYAPLEDEQARLYEAHVQNIRYSLLEQSESQLNREKIEILAELTKLRQICCDPALLYRNYRGNSEKENICMELLFSALSGGHKVLLFSQFTSMLDILTVMLRKRGISYHLLTGETPQRKRIEMIESFAHDDIPVFCISLKAGGTGINLTAADIVIHYDPWWNTAVEDQASDRAHRIGQENPVTVYKIIMQDTIEEKIIELQNSKAELAGRLLEDERMSSVSLTRDELMFLLSK